MEVERQRFHFIGLYAETPGIGPDILQGYHCALFHHIAEIACEGELIGFSLEGRCFDIKNLAACGSPCQSGHHSGVIISLISVA